jgi:diphthine-ammonia ligase
MVECIRAGHTVVALANLRPPRASGLDELDSHMFQTVGHEMIDAIAEATGLPLFRGELVGASLQTGMAYEQADAAGGACEPLQGRPAAGPSTEPSAAQGAAPAGSAPPQHDEVEDLHALLRRVRDELPGGVDAVSVGAILSDYQRMRVEHVCARLGLTALAYLWRRDQSQLLDDMAAAGVNAVLVKVAAMGLGPKHLGKSLVALAPLLRSLHARFGLHVCGEGGEFETLVLDAPVYRRRIVIDEAETICHADDAFAPVAYLVVRRWHLEDKEPQA